MITRDASWGPDDTIVIGSRGEGLMRVPAGGGEVTTLLAVDAPQQGWYPQGLPDGRRVLYTESEQRPEAGRLKVVDVATSESRLLLGDAVAGSIVSSGQLVFVRRGDLWSVTFDQDRLETQGEPVLLETGIRVEGGGAIQYASALDGTLAYIREDVDAVRRRTLVWVDRAGGQEPLPAPPRAYASVRIAPDGSRVAMDIADDDSDIWAWDFERQTPSPVVTSAGLDRDPVWYPDGRRLAFSSARDGTQNVYSQSADGAGAADRLTRGTTPQLPTSINHDGSVMLFHQPVRGSDLESLRLSGEGSTARLTSTSFTEAYAEFSPDGRWVAYHATESGHSEVYVRPYSDIGSGRWQVSTAGGAHPFWARDGRELFYRALDGAVVAVDVVAGDPTFRSTRPRQIVAADPSLLIILGQSRSVDVAPDGRRFLMIRTGPTTAGEERIVIVQNRFSTAPGARSAN